MGHDVVAVVEDSDLRGRADEVIFAAAQSQGRALVTEDVKDYRRIANRILASGGRHEGLVLTLNRTFPRANPRTLHRMVIALDMLLKDDPDLTSMERWLS
jgi:hypothetical protein